MRTIAAGSRTPLDVAYDLRLSGMPHPPPEHPSRLATIRERIRGMSRNRTIAGVTFLIAGIAVFSVQDLILKLLSGAYPLHQAMVLRSLAAIPALLLLALWDGGLRTLASSGWRGMAARGVLNFLAYTSYYLALAALPLATTVALFFTAPLFITALSLPFLGERVTPARWLALFAGFAGVLIIVRPGSDVFEWAALLPLFSGLFYGLAQILARRMGQHETATAMSFYSNFAFLGGAAILSGIFGTGALADEAQASLAFLTRGWATPTTRDLLLMLSCGVIAAIGLTFLTQAYRLAEASLVAPFEYTALVWGLLWGWLFWQDWPEPTDWAGIAVLVAAGLILLYGDRRPARRETQP